MAKRSRREVKVLRMEEAVTGAKSMISESARTHCELNGIASLLPSLDDPPPVMAEAFRVGGHALPQHLAQGRRQATAFRAHTS